MTAQLYDPAFGRSVKDGATDTCSKCGGTVPEEYVPLIVWNHTGDLMWVFCEKCEGPILARAVAPKTV